MLIFLLFHRFLRCRCQWIYFALQNYKEFLKYANKWAQKKRPHNFLLEKTS